jgi:MFS family permease
MPTHGKSAAMKRSLPERATLGADFTKLWIGQSISRLGSQISIFALPTFAVLALHAAPLQLGALAALQYVPFPIFGLIAGVWLDRLSRRAVMIAADAARFLLLASIPVVAVFHEVSWLQLYAVAFLAGTCSVFFDIGYASLVPSLVTREELPAANARMGFSDSAAQIAGNALGGAIVHAVGAALAIGIDALSYLASIVSLVTLKSPTGDAAATADRGRGAFRRELVDGVRWVLRNPDLRAIAAATATANLGISMSNAVLFLFYYRDLHLDPGAVGLILGLSNVGFVGALFSAAIARRLGLKRTLIGTAALAALANACLPLALYASPLLVIFVANAAESALLPVYNITQGTYRQLVTPPPMLGRMNATMRTIFWSSLPVGSLLGGALANVAGLVPTIWTGTAIAGCAALFLLRMRSAEGAAAPL